MTESTATSPTPGDWAGTKTNRLLAIIGGLAGALAISGSLVPWVTAHKGHVSSTIRGTGYGVGVLTLTCGIVLVAAAAARIFASGTRMRAATAVIALAAGAAVMISIGTGLATGTFLDQATVTKHHGHHAKGSKSSPTPTVVGAAYVPAPAVSGGPRRAADTAGSAFGSLASNGTAQHAQKGNGKGKGKGKKATTTTIQPGVFVALVGGVLGFAGGIWGIASAGRAAPAPGAVPAGSASPGPTPEPQEPVAQAGDPSYEPAPTLAADPI